MIATLLTPLRPLLDDYDTTFTAIKDVMTTAPVLSFYNVSKPTCLCTDASQHRLSFILQQQSNDATWNLIQAGSHFLNDSAYNFIAEWIKGKKNDNPWQACTQRF